VNGRRQGGRLRGGGQSGGKRASRPDKEMIAEESTQGLTMAAILVKRGNVVEGSSGEGENDREGCVLDRLVGSSLTYRNHLEPINSDKERRSCQEG
jgi:hypothetical protein